MGDLGVVALQHLNTNVLYYTSKHSMSFSPSEKDDIRSPEHLEAQGSNDSSQPDISPPPCKPGTAGPPLFRHQCFPSVPGRYANSRGRSAQYHYHEYDIFWRHLPVHRWYHGVCHRRHSQPTHGPPASVCDTDEQVNSWERLSSLHMLASTSRTPLSSYPALGCWPRTQTQRLASRCRSSIRRWRCSYGLGLS